MNAHSWADSLSLRFSNHFPGEPGLAGVYWSKGWWKWWWQLDYWNYKSYKAPVKSSPATNQHPVFLQAGCPSCHPTNSVKALKGKYHIPWTCLRKLTWGLPTLSLTTNSSWLSWGGLPCLSSALWCQYPNSHEQTDTDKQVCMNHITVNHTEWPTDSIIFSEFTNYTAPATIASEVMILW